MRVLLQGLRLFAVLVQLHSVLSAQPQLAPPRGNHTVVSGTVVNAVTGDPVRRALVTLNDRSMLTDGEGHFEFRNLPDPQGLAITANKPGFFDERDLSVGQSSEGLMVPAGASALQMVVKLVPEGVLTGTVESEGGPVEGVFVNVISSRIGEGSRHWELQGGGTTDEDGVFRIAGLRPGSYYLSIKSGMSHYILPAGNPPRPQGYAQSYYPGVPDLDGATPLEVLAGQEVHADFKLKLTPMYRISGTISGVDPDSGIVAQIRAVSGEIVDVVGVSTEGQPRFVVRVPAGSYTIKAQVLFHDRQAMVANLPIEVSGDIGGINLALSPMPSITVNVHTTSAAQPRTKQTVFDKRFPTGRGVENALAGVTLVNATAMANGPQYYASPGMVLKDVEPGVYQVVLQPLGGWYVASALSGNSDLLQGPLTVHSGSPPPPIEMELRNDGGMIQASAASENSPTAFSKTWVLVIPSGSPRWARAVLAQNQPAIFPDVAPGNYAVLAFDSIDGLEYKNPDVLEEFMGRATQVTVTPEQTVETKVELIQRTKP